MQNRTRPSLTSGVYCLKMLRGTLGALLLLVFSSSTAHAQMFGPSFLQLSAWTCQPSPSRFPAVGTYDLSSYQYVGGTIGLNPAVPSVGQPAASGDLSHGIVTFYWTSDASGLNIVGVQGMNLNSLIVSLNQIRLPNQGPYLYVTYKPVLGSNCLATNLFGTNAAAAMAENPSDTILVDYRNQPLPPGAAVAWYPDDYFAGQARFYLDAPPGVTATIYGGDLADAWWPLDSVSGGNSTTTVTPMGAWLVVVENTTGGSITYSVSVTPLVLSGRSGGH